MIKIVLIIAFSLGITSCSKPTSQQLTSQSPENTLVETSENIIFDAAKKTDQNAAEVFDLGSVSSSPIKKAFNISNTTGTNLSLSFTDLQSKISATTRFSLNLATATPCPASLKTNKSCSFEITLSKVSNESYDAIATNIISVASRGSNPEFGGMLFSGLKANDVSSTVPLSAVMRIDRLADSYIVPNGSSVTKRFYIGNVGSAILKTPGIVAPQGGTILVNSCSGIVSIKPNGTCFFEIRYTSDSAPEKASYNSEITFTSTDPLILTTGLKIDLAITNLPVVVPVVSANFNQVGSITDLTNANGKTRLYINNTGSTDLDTATITIPSQYSVTGTSCLPVLKVGKTCFYDLTVNVAQTSNSTAVIAPITIGSTSFGIKAGDPAVLNSPNPITTCKDGFSLVNNICETTQASCSIADATVNGVDFSRSNNTVQGMNINGDKTSCLLADNACDISSTLNPNKKSCDIKTFSVTVNKIAGQVAVADSTVGKISCGAACSSDSKNYDYGSAITLAAIAEPGYIVSNWTGCDSVVANNCVINSLTANTVVEPVMTLKQLSISTSYANAGLSGDVNSVTVYKNGNLCPSGACLNSFGINDIARIVVSPNSYINVDSFALNGSVSNLNTSVANEVSFSLQDQDVSAAISLSYKEFISQPEISYTGGNLNLSNLVTNGSSIGIVTSNATMAREMLVSTSADCSSGSYESLNLNRSFSPAQNQTSNLSIKYKNGDKYSQCFPITITHDNALPTISINTMAAINNSNKSAYTISGSCSENGQPVSISIGLLNSSVNCSSNEFSQTLDVSLLDDSASIVVSASISDLSSNVSSANSTVLKDVVAPTILINAMASINNSNKLEYTISGTCSDSSQPVSLSIGGINSSTTCNLLTFSHTMDVSSLVDSISLATSAIITDLAGNQSEDNTTVSKDTSAPTISFNLQSIITVNNQLAYSITGNCSENGQTINIQIDTLGINTTCNSNAFSTEADVSTVADSNSVTIDASISDSNDNITHAITTTSKDTISPSLSITAPLDLASISTNTLNISGTCSDSGGISSFIVSSADFATENIVCLGNGTVTGQRVSESDPSY